MTPVIVGIAWPLLEFVIVPALLMLPEKVYVCPPESALLNTRLLEPVIFPLKVGLALSLLLIVKAPVLVEANIIGLVNVRLALAFSVAATPSAMPSPSVMVPAPKAVAFVSPITCPAIITNP